MKTNSSTTTIGIDLGDRKHSIRVPGADGKILGESTITNSREAMARLSKKYPGALTLDPKPKPRQNKSSLRTARNRLL